MRLLTQKVIIGILESILCEKSRQVPAMYKRQRPAQKLSLLTDVGRHLLSVRSLFLQFYFCLVNNSL